MDNTTGIVGVILAGGLSRRMGGGDKGLLDLGGSSMIARVIDIMAPQVDALVINANGDPARFAPLGLPVAADPIDGFVGPLAGVLAGMRWAAENVPACRFILTVSSDAPFLPADLAERLTAGLAEDDTARIALAASADGSLHPVIGLWPVALADDLEAALHDGVRKVLDWTDRHGAIAVRFAPIPIGNDVIGGGAVDPFFNANTPEELDEARALLQKMS